MGKYSDYASRKVKKDENDDVSSENETSGVGPASISVGVQRIAVSELPNILNEEVKTEKRFSANIPYLDDCFEDLESGKKGFTKGQITLVTGDKGLGKSTLLLQLLDGLTASGCFTILATNEQTKNDMILMARRIQLKAGINIVVDDKTKASEIVQWVDF